ncbi:hypothetical protein SEVIR_2G066050v4 [Setaria viridis]|uniref:Uncharacterized protein n=1 Tax=Setaria viridis TaxID=4556 RepID=A0A4V6DAV9_SETVI|nr:hypothetical protein SEVIR_2G066050v2 [Setaria viridis]
MATVESARSPLAAAALPPDVAVSATRARVPSSSPQCLLPRAAAASHLVAAAPPRRRCPPSCTFLRSRSRKPPALLWPSIPARAPGGYLLEPDNRWSDLAGDEELEHLHEGASLGTQGGRRGAQLGVRSGAVHATAFETRNGGGLNYRTPAGFAAGNGLLLETRFGGAFFRHRPATGAVRSERREVAGERGRE